MPDVIYISGDDARDPRVAKLATLLHIERVGAFGLVCALWSHAMALNPDEELPGKALDVWRYALKPSEWSAYVLSSAFIEAGYVADVQGRWVLSDWSELVRRGAA